MKTRQNKHWTQLQLNFNFSLLYEIERRGESHSDYETLSLAFRRNIKADDTFLFWNALIGKEDPVAL